MARIATTILLLGVLILAGVALTTHAYQSGAADFRASLIETRSLDEGCPIVLYEDASFGCAYAD